MIFDTDFMGLARGGGTVFIKTILFELACLKNEEIKIQLYLLWLSFMIYCLYEMANKLL